MTEEERVNRNEAIARFLGWEYRIHELYNEWCWFPASPDFPEFYTPIGLEFDMDWHLLSHAIEKICLHRWCAFSIGPCIGGEWTATIAWIDAVAPDMIEAAWMAVSSYCLTFENPAPHGK